MKQTQATRVSATVIHRHKYISNTAVTPIDAIIATSRNLASELKDKMPCYLQESLLAELTQLSQIFSEAAAVPDIPVSQSAPPASQPPHPPPRRSPRLTTIVSKDRLTVDGPSPSPKPPSPLHLQRPPPPVVPPRVEPSVSAQRVEPQAPIPPPQAPRVEPPRRLARLAGANKPAQPSATSHRTRSNNINFLSVS